MDLLPFDDYVRSLNRKRMSAGVLYRDENDRVLIVEPSYKEHWDIPGGACDEGEPPWRTAAREVREELGTDDRKPGDLIVIDYISADDRMPEGLAFIFDGGLISDDDVAQLDITDPEIVSVNLMPLDAAAPKLKPILARRVAAALDAAHSGRLVICEDGYPVGS
ncbi:NUDIX hydrolase [Amycolatopsis sp. WAC 01375]|uniref:NUDIX domain-containing protein n=1 Tax=Amycolatopsis sp. WAC 01375 TaxID=2203194 RepID=UPI000F78CD07|nr:NUDIX hydrolase [Amycolatopsis sp. WAC 01375]RSM80520.1 NUDIX hydrolase [Amycolatopsis sp. WAC 01375]